MALSSTSHQTSSTAGDSDGSDTFVVGITCLELLSQCCALVLVGLEANGPDHAIIPGYKKKKKKRECQTSLINL